MTINTTLIVNRHLDAIRNKDAKGFDNLVAIAIHRLREQAHRSLMRFSSLRDLGEQTDAVLSGAVLRLTVSLRKIHPETAREFFGLAAENIRRELLELKRSAYGSPGLRMLFGLGLTPQQVAAVLLELEATVAEGVEAGRHPPELLKRVRRGNLSGGLMAVARELAEKALAAGAPPAPADPAAFERRLQAVQRWWQRYGPQGARRPGLIGGDDSSAPGAPEPAADDQGPDLEDEESFSELIDMLPPERRGIVRLLFHDGLTQAQVAAVLVRLEVDARARVESGKLPAGELDRLRRGVIGADLKRRAAELSSAAAAGTLGAPADEAEQRALESKLKSVKRWWASAREALVVSLISRLPAEEKELGDLLYVNELPADEAREVLGLGAAEFDRRMQALQMALAERMRVDR